jgi:DNA repair photolyase
MARSPHRGEEWGSFVDVKINALKLLASELRRKPKGLVLLSSVTDPYQLVEKKYELTRRILQIFAEHRFPVSVLTKSDLVIRDIDVIKKIQDCEVGLTITSLDEGVNRIFEPCSSSVEGRLNVLRRLHEAGIETYAFLGPMLPYLSEDRLLELLHRLCEAGVNRILVDRLNLKAGNWNTIHGALKENLPGFLPRFEGVLFESSGYYEGLKSKILELCRSCDLKVDFCY